MSTRPRIITRLWAFIRGDMMTAEDFGGYPEFSTPPVLARARTDETLADYLVDVADKERDRADAVLSGVQSKAASFAALVIGLLPFAVGGATLAVPPSGADLVRWSSFALLVAAVGSLLGASFMATLSSGMGKTASINLDWVEENGSPKTNAELKADEAGVWHYAAKLDEETSHRRVVELFRARQLTFLALVSALLGLSLLAISVEGHTSLFVGAQSPSQPILSTGQPSHSP